MSRQTLRVIDLGRVSALRSQTLWHAIAHGVSTGAPATLSFMRPDSPYVSIGFHSRLDQVDLERCEAAGLPVFRRMVGGGPVYLDDGQLFFQIAVPANTVPALRSAAIRHLLKPAVTAFRRTGVDARLDETNEISIGDRKICGHAAGQIGDAVIVVGNLISRFDYEAAAAILHAPSEEAAAEVRRLVRRYVSAIPADAGQFREQATTAYRQMLGLEPLPGELNSAERIELERLDARFVDPQWLRGPDVISAGVWSVKVRAGVWVYGSPAGPTRATMSLAAGRIIRARLVDPALDGGAIAAERRLAGLTLGEAHQVLSAAGEAGQRLAAEVARWLRAGAPTGGTRND